MPHPPRGGLLLYAASASPVYHTQLKPRGSYSLKAPFHLILFLGGVGLLKSKPRSTHTLRKHCTPVLSPSPGISLRSRSSTWPLGWQGQVGVLVSGQLLLLEKAPQSESPIAPYATGSPGTAVSYLLAFQSGLAALQEHDASAAHTKALGTSVLVSC